MINGIILLLLGGCAYYSRTTMKCSGEDIKTVYGRGSGNMEVTREMMAGFVITR